MLTEPAPVTKLVGVPGLFSAYKQAFPTVRRKVNRTMPQLTFYTGVCGVGWRSPTALKSGRLFGSRLLALSHQRQVSAAGADLNTRHLCRCTAAGRACKAQAIVLLSGQSSVCLLPAPCISIHCMQTASLGVTGSCQTVCWCDAFARYIEPFSALCDTANSLLHHILLTL